MSGIYAVLDRTGQVIDPELLERMSAASMFPAWNGSETWIDGEIGLAHRHLWITPEEQGERQPLHDPTGRYAIVADARIDNRDEIAQALEIGSQTVADSSDAMLILYAFRHWGPECIDHLLGDFVFAIWDSEASTIFVARDALGAYSVCYYISDNWFLLSSDIGPILAHPAVQAKLNRTKVFEYLTAIPDNHEDTFYQNIHYCPPGHCLSINAYSVQKWRYWEINPTVQIRYSNHDEYADHFLDLLVKAVHTRLRGVGKVGVSMSGGLDSTSLASLTATLLPTCRPDVDRLTSLSYVFDTVVTCDERPYIDSMVDRYDLESIFIPCDDKWTLRNIASWPVVRDFVVSDPYVRLPEAVIHAGHDAGCRVLIGGYYGDTLFAGSRFWVADAIRDLRISYFSAFIFDNTAWSETYEDLLKNGFYRHVPPAVKDLHREGRPAPYSQLHPGVHESMNTGHFFLDNRKRWVHDRNRLSAAGQWERFRSITHSVISQGAAATRYMYNGRGIELVTPYWDRLLVEFVMALPSYELGIRTGNRAPLRQALTGILPEPVRVRTDKTTFVPLFHKGLIERERETVREIFTRPRIFEEQFVGKDWIAEVLSSETSYRRNLSFLWMCISLELWLKKFW